MKSMLLTNDIEINDIIGMRLIDIIDIIYYRLEYA